MSTIIFPPAQVLVHAERTDSHWLLSVSVTSQSPHFHGLQSSHSLGLQVKFKALGALDYKLCHWFLLPSSAAITVSGQMKSPPKMKA